MSEIDRVVHEPVRLRILSILKAVDLADFTFLVSTMGLSRGTLSSHMDKLERAGYVDVQKGFKGKIPHTDYSITKCGLQALEEYWIAIDTIRNSEFKRDA